MQTWVSGNATSIVLCPNPPATGALSSRGPTAVTSIYTYGESVYGFALTRPSEPVCQ